MQEIKEPYNSDTALRESEAKFRQLTGLMPMAIFSTDKNGLITFYNEKAVELWGRRPRLNDPTETRYCGSWKLYKTDGTPLPHDLCPMSSAIKGKKSFRNEEIIMEKPDGTRIYARVNIDPVYSADGEVTGAINVFEDVTEAKRINEGVYRLAAIVESSEDAIISKNLDGIITSWNMGAQKMFGYLPEEAIGKHITLLIPPLLRDEETSIIKKIRSGQKVEHFDTIRMTKDGRSLNISLTVSPIRNEEGVIIGASKIARDITERVKLDNQLRLYNEKLKEMNTYKDEFMAMASHELKTPLTVIKANLQLLQIKLKENPHEEFVSKTMKQVNKLSNLISDLLDVSKIQTGNLQLNLTDFDLCALVTETIDNIQQTASSHKITIEGCTKDAQIKADRLRIEQVIVNVLTNAVKYSPQADKVIVKLSKDDKNVTVCVQDFGIGIPIEDVRKIFSRFYRVRGLASTFSGSGIGLYISNEIVKRHGGKMWVESTEDKGSAFYFSLAMTKSSSNHE